MSAHAARKDAQHACTEGPPGPPSWPTWRRPSPPWTTGDVEATVDGTAIQRTLGERHGKQRFRLGWREEELKRDFEILREELSAAIRRRIHTERPSEVEETLDV